MYAAWLLPNGLARELKVSNARMALAMDLAWVVGSIPVVLFAPLTIGGRCLIAMAGVVVSLIAFLQWRGIRILRARLSDAPRIPQISCEGA
jgi:hypothetical protein